MSHDCEERDLVEILTSEATEQFSPYQIYVAENGARVANLAICIHRHTKSGSVFSHLNGVSRDALETDQEPEALVSIVTTEGVEVVIGVLDTNYFGRLAELILNSNSIEIAEKRGALDFQGYHW